LVELLVDGELRKFRLYVDPIDVNGKTIERIVCEDGLTQLLHARPQAAQFLFRMIGNLYHGKQVEFPVDLVPSENQSEAVITRFC